MKKMNLRVAALLFCGAILTTSCQGLIDAIVGDNVAQPTVPTTTPAKAKPTEAKVTIEDEEYIISSLSELDKLMKELDEQLWGNSSEEDPVEVTITPGEDFAITDEDNTITLPFADDANVVVNITDDITTSKDKPLVIKSEKGKEGESNDVTINLMDDDDEEDDYLTVDMPSSNVSLESDKGATYDKVVSTADEITVGNGVTVEELEIEEGRYKETKDGGEVKNVTYNYNPIKIRETDAGSGDDDAEETDENVTDVELQPGEKLSFTSEIAEEYADEEEAKSLKVTWESDDPTVATCDQDGVITAIKDGFAVITATIEGDKYAKVDINVSVETIPKDISAIQPYTAGGDPFNPGAAVNDIPAEVSQMINKTWEKGDVLTQVQNGKKTRVSVKEVNADGSAILDLDSRNFDNNAKLSLVYPSYVITMEVSNGYEYSLLPFKEPIRDHNPDKVGTLEYFKEFNIYSGTGKLTLAKNKTVGAIEMKPQVALWKLTLQNQSGQPLKAAAITILADDITLTEFEKAGGMDEVYLPVWGDEKQRKIAVRVKDADGKSYVFAKKNVTIAAGKYYESTIKLETALTSFTLNATSFKLEVGQTANIVKMTATPEECKYTSLNWKSDNEAVATLSDAKGELTKVTAKGVGTAKIIVTAADNSGVTVTCNVAVGPFFYSKLEKLSGTRADQKSLLENFAYGWTSYYRGLTPEQAYALAKFQETIDNKPVYVLTFSEEGGKYIHYVLSTDDKPTLREGRYSDIAGSGKGPGINLYYVTSNENPSLF